MSQISRGRAKRLGRRRPQQPMPKPRSQNELTLTRQAAPQEQVITISSADVDAWKTGALAFYAADFPGISDLTTIFEKYRINWVQVDFLLPGVAPIQTDTYFATMPMRLCTAPDYDDDVSPGTNTAGWLSLQQRTGARTDIVGGSSTKFSRHLRPKVLVELYRSATTTAYSPTDAPFIDAEKTDVPHYGLKFSLMVPKTAAATSGFDLRFDVVVTYNITFLGAH